MELRKHLIAAAPKEPKHTTITQDLQLLAHLRFNVVVVRVPRRNFMVEAGIEGEKRELPLSGFSLKLMDTGENIGSPSTSATIIGL